MKLWILAAFIAVTLHAQTCPNGYTLTGGVCVANANGGSVGPAGPTGPTGPTGPAGPTGTPSTLAYTNYGCTAMWGDSLIAGFEGNINAGSIPGVFAATNQTVTNNGVGGQTSTQIATRMLAASSSWPCFTVLEGGRNNYTSGSTVQADFASMVAVLPHPSRYLVLGVMNGDLPTEVSGQTNYNTIVALNSALATTYGVNFFDMRAFINSQGNASNPIDVINTAQGVPPSSLRAIYAQGTLGAAMTDTTSCPSVLTATAGTLTSGYVVTVDSEEILATTIVGTAVTVCTRGYGATTAATHLTAAPFSEIDTLHLNLTGYALIAKQIASLISAMDPSIRLGSLSLDQSSPQAIAMQVSTLPSTPLYNSAAYLTFQTDLAQHAGFYTFAWTGTPGSWLPWRQYFDSVSAWHMARCAVATNVGLVATGCVDRFVFQNSTAYTATTITPLSANRTFTMTDNNGTVPVYVSAVSSSIGGSSVAAGACASGSVTVTAVPGGAFGLVVAQPATYPGDAFNWSAYKSGGNTVTVRVCNHSPTAATPSAGTYLVMVIPAAGGIF